jgi:hypothetical protein
MEEEEVQSERKIRMKLRAEFTCKAMEESERMKHHMFGFSSFHIRGESRQERKKNIRKIYLVSFMNEPFSSINFQQDYL